jgi:hypothetical protein
MPFGATVDFWGTLAGASFTSGRLEWVKVRRSDGSVNRYLVHGVVPAKTLIERRKIKHACQRPALGYLDVSSVRKMNSTEMDGLAASVVSANDGIQYRWRAIGGTIVAVMTGDWQPVVADRLQGSQLGLSALTILRPSDGVRGGLVSGTVEEGRILVDPGSLDGQIAPHVWVEWAIGSDQFATSTRPWGLKSLWNQRKAAGSQAGQRIPAIASMVDWARAEVRRACACAGKARACALSAGEVGNLVREWIEAGIVTKKAVSVAETNLYDLSALMGALARNHERAIRAAGYLTYEWGVDSWE